MKKTLLLLAAFAMCSYASAGAQEIQAISIKDVDVTASDYYADEECICSCGCGETGCECAVPEAEEDYDSAGQVGCGCTDCDPCECVVYDDDEDYDYDYDDNYGDIISYDEDDDYDVASYDEDDDYYYDDFDYDDNFSYKSRRWFKGHYQGLSIGYTRLVSSLGDWSLPIGYKDMEQKWNSVTVSVNIVDFPIPFTSSFGLVTGAGVEMNNFKFKNDIAMQRVNGVTEIDYSYINNGINLKKSKMTTYYLNVPLLLEGQFGRQNQFWINGGIIGGVRLGSYTKIVSDDPSIDGKLKQTGNIRIRNFHYGYRLGLGTKHLGLTATYYPGRLFKSGTGPDVEQFSIGLIFMRK